MQKNARNMKKEFLIPEVEVIELENCEVVVEGSCSPINTGGVVNCPSDIEE